MFNLLLAFSMLCVASSAQNSWDYYMMNSAPSSMNLIPSYSADDVKNWATDVKYTMQNAIDNFTNGTLKAFDMVYQTIMGQSKMYKTNAKIFQNGVCKSFSGLNGTCADAISRFVRNQLDKFTKSVAAAKIMSKHPKSNGNGTFNSNSCQFLGNSQEYEDKNSNTSDYYYYYNQDYFNSLKNKPQA